MQMQMVVSTDNQFPFSLWDGLNALGEKLFLSPYKQNYTVSLKHMILASVQRSRFLTDLWVFM